MHRPSTMSSILRAKENVNNVHQFAKNAHIHSFNLIYVDRTGLQKTKNYRQTQKIETNKLRTQIIFFQLISAVFSAGQSKCNHHMSHVGFIPKQTQLLYIYWRKCCYKKRRLGGDKAISIMVFIFRKRK